jgi:rubrerythrin
MIKENCPFCGHRWTRRRDESPITCPGCQRKYLSPEKLEEIRLKKK